MERQTLSALALDEMIAIQVAVLPQCAGCVVGSVIQQPRGETGSNWKISVITGHRCFECLEALSPVMKEMQSQYLLGAQPDENASFLTTWAMREDPNAG